LQKIETLKTHTENILKKSDKFADKDGKLFIYKIIEAIENIDIDLVQLLVEDERTKKHFFTTTKDFCILNQNNLIELFSMNEYLLNSFTSYKNKIGLIKKDSFIKKFDDVVLAFPYKDCVLEGGQTKDDDKNNEVFYNNVLSADEVDRLFEPKVLTNIKKFNKEGEHRVDKITEDDNLIIKGNNLLALHSLKERYRGKVKLIYIDPPYNTGNDSFNYNDNFNHSTWLTFMKNRLEIAKEFLSDDGVIFVQCDDNEQAYLKVLMDELFGRVNFISSLVWKGRGGRQDSKYIAQVHETIIVYAKNIVQTKIKKKIIKDDSKYNFYDELKEKNYKLQLVRKWGSNSKREDRPNLYYKVEFENEVIVPILPNGNDGCWRWSKRRLEDAIKNNMIVKQINNDKIELYEKIYQGDGKREIVYNSWLEETFSGKGIKQIENLFNEKVFEYPKPEDLIKSFLDMATNKNDLIMDFHLGSGTTCAVAHKMGRRYIGIEQMDYIEDIAVERMKKVIDGEQGGISKSVEWKGGGSFIYAELKEIKNFKEYEIGALNKNMQYLPIGEIDDEEYKIDNDEIALNKKFYGVDDE